MASVPWRSRDSFAHSEGDVRLEGAEQGWPILGPAENVWVLPRAHEHVGSHAAHGVKFTLNQAWFEDRGSRTRGQGVAVGP